MVWLLGVEVSAMFATNTDIDRDGWRTLGECWGVVAAKVGVLLPLCGYISKLLEPLKFTEGSGGWGAEGVSCGVVEATENGFFFNRGCYLQWT
jgi:hypothetical protein